MRTRPTHKQAGGLRSQASTAVTASLLALFALGALFYLDRPAAVANDHERFEFGADIERPFGEKTVKGAPFSAQVILENSQTLANGTHISQKITGALYRDSEGRTRQEFPRDGAPEIVRINDNVSGVLYDLHMFQQTVTKVHVSDSQTSVSTINGTEVLSNRQSEERRRSENEERERVERTKTINSERSRKEIEPERKVESLGMQTFEGVQAEVTRFTLTIPTGMQGNDQRFEIVSERWYSPELQVVLMSKRSDPRTGDVVYRLANISRTDPTRSLFEAPPGFTVREEKREFRREK